MDGRSVCLEEGCRARRGRARFGSRPPRRAELVGRSPWVNQDRVAAAADFRDLLHTLWPLTAGRDFGESRSFPRNRPPHRPVRGSRCRPLTRRSPRIARSRDTDANRTLPASANRSRVPSSPRRRLVTPLIERIRRHRETSGRATTRFPHSVGPLALARAVARAAHSPGGAAGATSDFRGPYPPPPGRVPSTEIGRLCRPPGESGRSRARGLPSRRHGRSRRSLRSPESHVASTLNRTGSRFRADTFPRSQARAGPFHTKSTGSARGDARLTPAICGRFICVHRPAPGPRFRQTLPAFGGSLLPESAVRGWFTLFIGRICRVRDSRTSAGRAPHRASFWRYGPPARSRRAKINFFPLKRPRDGRGKPPCRS